MPVDQHPAAFGVHTGDHLADRDQPSGSTVPGGNVAARAWSSPPVRIHSHGSRPRSRAASSKPADASIRPRSIRIPTPDASAMCRGRRRDRRRRRSSRSRRLPRPRRPARRAVGDPVRVDQLRRTRNRRVHAGEQQRQSRSRPAERPGDSDDVALSRTRAQHRTAAFEVAEDRHRHDDLVGLHQIAADHTRAESFRGTPRPSEMPAATASGVSGGQPSETRNAVGRPPIAAMSAPFWATAFRPTCSGVDQSSRKCRCSTSMSADTAAGRPASAPRPRRRPARAASSTVACVVPRPARSPRTPPPTPRCDRRRPAAVARIRWWASQC